MSNEQINVLSHALPSLQHQFLQNVSEHHVVNVYDPSVQIRTYKRQLAAA